jgi:hypothetical protein
LTASNPFTVISFSSYSPSPINLSIIPLLAVIFVSLAIENYKLQGNLIKLMESVQKLNGIGLTLGSILGYIAILAGIIMTILLLEAVFQG